MSLNIHSSSKEIWYWYQLPKFSFHNSNPTMHDNSQLFKQSQEHYHALLDLNYLVLNNTHSHNSLEIDHLVLSNTLSHITA